VTGPGGDVDLPSEGVARVIDHATSQGHLDGMEIVDIESGQVEGLPDLQAGITLVVSRVLAMACPDRDDLVFPFGEVRDAEGRIVAVRALARFASRGRGSAQGLREDGGSP
jgi:hypothetical protein